MLETWQHQLCKEENLYTVPKNKVAIHLLKQLNAPKMPKACIIMHQMQSTKIERFTT